MPGGETLNDRLRRAAAMARRETPQTSVAPNEPQPKERQEPPQETYRPEPQRPAPNYRETPPEQPRHAHRIPAQEYVTEPASTRKQKPMTMWIAILAGRICSWQFLPSYSYRSHTTRKLQNSNSRLSSCNWPTNKSSWPMNMTRSTTSSPQYENQTSLLANDSIVQKYSAARAQVEKLLQELKNEKNKSAAQISKLKDEIATLKGILRNYVEQINALNQENQELRTENQEVKAQKTNSCRRASRPSRPTTRCSMSA